MKRIFIAVLLSVLFAMPCFAGEQINFDELKACLQQTSDNSVKETDAKLRAELDKLDKAIMKQEIEIIKDLNSLRLMIGR